MIDFGLDKIALIGAVALIVIGPEKLPRMARTVGHLFGKAQRYVADVKAEVNRSIELDELKKMKTEFEDAARNVESSVSGELHKTTADLHSAWDSSSSSSTSSSAYDPGPDGLPANSGQHTGWMPVPEYRRLKKNWRLKRSATPQWYKRKAGIRGKAQSGAARVARFRPRPLG